MVTKECINCKKNFNVIESRKNTAHFCCINCKRLYNRVKGTCIFCGKEVLVFKSRKGFKYCSKECYNKAAKTNLNILRHRRMIKCKCCEKEFSVQHKSKRKFCSMNCSNIWNSKFRKKSKTGEYIKCKNCGNNFYLHKYRKTSGKFCSTECYNNYRRDIRTCPTCNYDFLVPSHYSNIYCSQACFAKSSDKRKSKFSVSVNEFLIDVYKDVKNEVLFLGDDHKYFVDFLMGDLAIECDGTYWHCDPNVYDKNYYHSKIKKYAFEIWEYDKRKDIILEKTHGLKILRLKEKMWRDNRELFFKNTKEKINEILKNN